jgi:L-fuconolactonase
MLIVDSQVHLFDPRSLEQAERIGQHVIRPAEIVAAMDEAGVSLAYLVPSGSGANQACLDAMTRWPSRFRVMGGLRLNRPREADLLPGWQQAGFAGLRLTFPPFREPSWLRDGTADWVWPAAERLGLPIMLWAPGQLAELASIAERHPALRLVIDHLNLYVEDRGTTVYEVVDQVIRLARFSNVAVKASALPANSQGGFPFRDMHEAVKRAVDSFGPDRVFWGTDYTRMACTLTEAVKMFTDHLGFLSDSDMEKVMGIAITSWVGWPDNPLP